MCMITSYSTDLVTWLISLSPLSATSIISDSLSMRVLFKPLVFLSGLRVGARIQSSMSTTTLEESTNPSLLLVATDVGALDTKGIKILFSFLQSGHENCFPSMSRYMLLYRGLLVSTLLQYSSAQE